MYFQVSAALLIIGLALFMAYACLLTYSNARLGTVERCHLRNSFPYNFYMNVSLPTRILLYALLLIASLTTMVGQCFFFLSFSNPYFLCLAIVCPLSLACLLISNLLPLTFYRSHILLAAVGFFITSLSGLLFAFSNLVVGSSIIEGNLCQPIQIVIGVLSGILLLAMFNPKLMNWYKMEKTEENGKTYYVKPKLNFFALYEWLFLFSHYIFSFLLFLNVIVTQ
jgi:hypothetical protein